MAPLAVAGVILWLNGSRLPFGRSSQDRTKEIRRDRIMLAASLDMPLAGTPSCSARGCHGAIEPVRDEAQCQQNEYVRWNHDRHADAYRVLFSERSQTIARLLGAQQQAHDDPRCLACHANPMLANLPADNPFVQEEKLFGVGCESCHGSAKAWLAVHTAPDWRTKKGAYAMPDLTDAAVAAKTCAGCHVGAPPDKATPLRDVNHDLIAAGHPRLNFEFGTYLANMPVHWRAKKKPEGHLWAVGQLVSAQAALELLSHRAKSSPWPELAEYDCFACHHSLAVPKRRQTNRKPGELPWGSWYFALTDQAQELRSLRATMQKPFPPRAQVVAEAQAALKKLPKRPGQFAGAKTNDATFDRQHLHALLKQNRVSTDPSWDVVEQTYLALHALNQSLADPAVAEALKELTPLRAFAPGFDGPLSLTYKGNTRFEPKFVYERLRGLREKQVRPNE